MSRIVLPANGFLSYVRKDDELTGKRISRLCEMVRSALELRLGHEVEIFQDIATMRNGAVWEKRTREAIDGASFLIPIVTPAYLRSPWCAKEVGLFQERERELIETYPALARSSLIFPIHLTETDDTDADEQGLFEVLQQRQLFDFRAMLYSDYDTPAVRGAIAGFVADIRALLRTPLEQSPPKPPPSIPTGKPRKSKAAAPPPRDEAPPDATTLQPPPPPEPDPPPGDGGRTQTERTALWFLGGTLAIVLLGVLFAVLGSSPSYVNNSTYAYNGADPCSYDYNGLECPNSTADMGMGMSDVDNTANSAASYGNDASSMDNTAYYNTTNAM